jgi:ABC-2 type transport system ATP-binding protein
MTTIHADGLTKQYRELTAVDDLTFTVRPGRVTGFVGPNGAGKTTTLRMLLGLTRPTAGSARFDARSYGELSNPARLIGASLDPNSFHPGRRGRNALCISAATIGASRQRVEEVLELVGLADAASRRVKTFSSGMLQRLSIADALIGDPEVLIFDEPTSGLDPGGIHWLRGFLRMLAGQGRTVLVSSHQLAELEQTIDDALLIDRGQEVVSGDLDSLLADGGHESLEDLFLARTTTGALR